MLRHGLISTSACTRSGWRRAYRSPACCPTRVSDEDRRSSASARCTAAPSAKRPSARARWLGAFGAPAAQLIVEGDRPGIAQRGQRLEVVVRRPRAAMQDDGRAAGPSPAVRSGTCPSGTWTWPSVIGVRRFRGSSPGPRELREQRLPRGLDEVVIARHHLEREVRRRVRVPGLDRLPAYDRVLEPRDGEDGRLQRRRLGIDVGLRAARSPRAASGAGGRGAGVLDDLARRAAEASELGHELVVVVAVDGGIGVRELRRPAAGDEQRSRLAARGGEAARELEGDAASRCSCRRSRTATGRMVRGPHRARRSARGRSMIGGSAKRRCRPRHLIRTPPRVAGQRRRHLPKTDAAPPAYGMQNSRKPRHEPRPRADDPSVRASGRRRSSGSLRGAQALDRRRDAGDGRRGEEVRQRELDRRNCGAASRPRASQAASVRRARERRIAFDDSDAEDGAPDRRHGGLGVVERAVRASRGEAGAVGRRGRSRAPRPARLRRRPRRRGSTRPDRRSSLRAPPHSRRRRPRLAPGSAGWTRRSTPP